MGGALERRKWGMAEEEEDEDGRMEGEPCGLLGIPLLYVGDDGDGTTTMAAAADSETIWGRVDLQNNALMWLLRKRIGKLAKRCGGGDGGRGWNDGDKMAPCPMADKADVHNCEDVPAIAMEEVLPLHASRSRGTGVDQVSANFLHRSFFTSVCAAPRSRPAERRGSKSTPMRGSF
jgi:hypothetical protein